MEEKSIISGRPNSVKKIKNIRKAEIGLLISLIIGFTLILIPFNHLSYNGRAALAITGFTISMWIFEVLPVEVSSILLPVLYCVFKVAAPSVAFSGFANPVTWFIFIALIYGAVINISGLGKRIAINIIRFTGTSFLVIMISILLAGLALSFITPAGVERIVILYSIVLGLAGAFGMTDEEFRKSNVCKVAMGIVYLASNVIGLGILTSIAPNVIAQGLIKDTLKVNVSWMQWLVWFEVPILISCAIAVALLFIMFKPESVHLQKSYANDEIEKLGPMSDKEKRAALYVTLSLILWITGNITNLTPWAVGTLISVLFVAPGIGVIEGEDLKGLPVNVVIFSGAAISIGSTLLQVGVGDWLGNNVLGPLINHEMGMPLVAMITFLVSSITHVVFVEGTTISAAMVPIVAHYFSSVGIPALGPSLIVAMTSGAVGFFPAMQLPMLLLIGFGYLSSRDAIKILSMYSVVVFAVFFVAAFTWFRWFGLL